MRRWLGLSVCIFAVGCISTNVQRVDGAVRPARTPDLVTVLLEEPQRPYTVIAIIEAKSRTVFDGFDDLREEMVAEAAKLGGEALILVSKSTDSEFVFTGTAMIESDQRNLTGEVIVFGQGD